MRDHKSGAPGEENNETPSSLDVGSEVRVLVEVFSDESLSPADLTWWGLFSF